MATISKRNSVISKTSLTIINIFNCDSKDMDDPWDLNDVIYINEMITILVEVIDSYDYNIDEYMQNINLFVDLVLHVYHIYIVDYLDPEVITALKLLYHEMFIKLTKIKFICNMQPGTIAF